MGKDNLDRIITSSPLNKSAAMVVAKGEHWEPEAVMPPGMMHWKSPPPLQPYKPDPKGSIDLTGRKFGRFTVIGVWNSPPGKNRGVRWIVRCTCGDFEARSTSSIKMACAEINENLISQKCWNCMQLEVIQKRYKKRGAKSLTSFIDAPRRTIETELKTPETIIAGIIGEDAYALAVKIVGELNRSGYRIIREKVSTDMEVQ